jgi:hypothetical protein
MPSCRLDSGDGILPWSITGFRIRSLPGVDGTRAVDADSALRPLLAVPGIETGIYSLLAATLIAVTFVIVRRRDT